MVRGSPSRRCANCTRPGALLCPRCLAGLAPPPADLWPPSIDWAAALWAHEGVGRSLVLGLKYSNRRALVGRFGRALALLVAADGPGLPDVVTWVPASAGRTRRGYDQAELLARACAARLGCPARSLLVRRAGDVAQTSRRAARQRSVGPALRARAGRGLGGARVLVVDDVCTTGSTLARAAVELRANGAEAVDAVVLGRRPLKVAASGAETSPNTQVSEHLDAANG